MDCFKVGDLVKVRQHVYGYAGKAGQVVTEQSNGYRVKLDDDPMPVFFYRDELHEKVEQQQSASSELAEYKKRLAELALREGRKRGWLQSAEFRNLLDEFDIELPSSQFKVTLTVDLHHSDFEDLLPGEAIAERVAKMSAREIESHPTFRYEDVTGDSSGDG